LQAASPFIRQGAGHISGKSGKKCVSSFFALAAQNILSPMVLFFGLGLLAAFARSDLSIPESIAKTMALYLLLAIGFKGGASMSGVGFDLRLVAALGLGVILSFSIPLAGYALLRLTTGLSKIDAAAVAAHYGSISIVTFVAGTQAVSSLGFSFEPWIVAVAAVMEFPAILTALWLASRAGEAKHQTEGGELFREIAFNGSIVMLVGSFLIGWITGKPGLDIINPFIGDPFRGVLCLFLLDMGIVAGRGLRQGAGELEWTTIAFGIYMPMAIALLTAVLVLPLDLSVGGHALFVILAASASYIAVPAAMRVALPEAKPAIYLTMSLGVTFPFNLTLGIPAYLMLVQALKG
jgi:uncharacterized protein